MADRKPREVRSDFASDHSFSPGNFQEKQPFSNTEGGVFRFVRFFSPRRLLRFLTFRSGRILAQSLHLGHSRVPTHLQSAFDYSRLRVLALFLPFFLFAQLLSAPVVAVCLWSIDYWAALMLVACVESLVGLWTISKWSFLSSFCECPIRSWFAGREASPAKNLGYAWTYSQIARSLRLLNGALGVVWGWFLICVFHMPSEKAHIVAVIVCMGLFAPLLLCSVVSGAVEALVLPVVAAACLVMAQHFCGALAFLILSLFLETTVCGLFVIGVSRLARYLLQRLLQDRLEQRERNEIMSMMARGSDSHIGDWIWEIDANGCIQTPSDEFCTLLERSSEDMAGMRLVDLLALPVIQPGRPLPLIDGQPMSASVHLAHCLANRLAFRDLCIPVKVGENTNWWLMTGRPVFRQGVLHGYRGIGANVTGQRNARSLYAERIRHDELTGLLNRLAFCEQLQSALLEKIALFRFGALLFLSLDNFFRDGVETQDETSRNELLSETGNRLRRFAKDKPGVAGRYGKAEFSFFPIVQDPLSSEVEDAKSLALELMAFLEKPMVLSDGAVLSARVSAGIAPVSGKGQTLEILLEAADMALHDARGKTQERYSFYERLTLEDEERQRYLLQDVRQAVQERAFSLVYQPIVDAQTGAINGFEALSRWNGSRHGPLSIERVIGLIEVSGRGSEFDFWVLETACEAAVKWPSHLWVAVNMMASQFSQPQVAERILATLSRCQFSKSMSAGHQSR